MWSKFPAVLHDILTPEQRVAINQHRLGLYVKGTMANRIKLTEEQNKKVESLLDKLAQDAKLTLDWPTYQSVSKKVNELLTPEQRDVLQKPLQSPGLAGGAAVALGGASGPLVNYSGQYWIGLIVEPLSAEQRTKLKAPDDRGMTVQVVIPDSPAAKAGVKKNDVILKAGERPVKGTQDFVKAIGQAKDKELVLELIRDGQKQKIAVKPAKRPAEGA